MNKKEPKSNVISFYSYRGGTGKSTLSSNIVKIASLKHKAILIDLDLYSPQLSYIFEKENEHYINDYFHTMLFQPDSGSKRKIDLSDIICKSNFKNLDLILANPIISLSDKTILHDEIISKRIFPCIQHMVEILRADYDLILIDCPGELNFYTLNAIAVSDRAVGVSLPTRANIKGMIELMKIFNVALHGKISDIILTMISTRPSQRKIETLEKWKIELKDHNISDFIFFYYSENIAYRHQFEDDFFYLPEEEEYKQLEEYLQKITE